MKQKLIYLKKETEGNDKIILEVNINYKAPKGKIFKIKVYKDIEYKQGKEKLRRSNKLKKWDKEVKWIRKKVAEMEDRKIA